MPNGDVKVVRNIIFHVIDFYRFNQMACRKAFILRKILKLNKH